MESEQADSGKVGASGMEAFVFDLDGVIIDSEPLHEAAFFEIFAELGHSEDHGIEFARFYGTSDQAVWNEFLERHPQKAPLETLSARKEQRFFELSRKKDSIFPEIRDLVSTLSKRFKLAVASGSKLKVIQHVLAQAGLTSYFQSIASAEETSRGKPHPDVYQLAAHRLGVAPEVCYALEDSVHGGTSANSAGMKSIAIPNTFEAGTLSHAWRVIESYMKSCLFWTPRTNLPLHD